MNRLSSLIFANGIEVHYFFTVLLLAGTAAAQYKGVNLVADQPGLAKYQDSNIGDAWDIAQLPNGGFAVANGWTGVLTFYSRDGRTMRSPVTVPAAAILGPGAVGSPAGLALNPTFNYVISKNGKSAPSILLIATLDGLICGWNPAVDPDNAVIVIDNSTGSPFPAGYVDLSFARNRDGNMVMYVTDGGQTLVTANNWIAVGNDLVAQVLPRAPGAVSAALPARHMHGTDLNHSCVTFACFSCCTG